MFLEMGSEDVGVSKGRDCDLDHGGRHGNFNMEGGRCRKASRGDSEGIEAVVGVVSRKCGVRRKELAGSDAGTGEIGGGHAGKSGHFGSSPEEVEMGRGYEFGDMVWGKVRSHPWWPGRVFDEALAVSCVLETKRDGHVLVAFFGDDSYGWLSPEELVGFDLYYVEKSKQTNASAFMAAVQEAEEEVGRRAALGLLCQCGSPGNFRPTGVKGCLAVDVPVYGPGGLYTVQQLRSARVGFRPVEMLYFVKRLGLMPCVTKEKCVRWLKNVATVISYRRAVFKKSDTTYANAFEEQSSFISNSRVNLAQWGLLLQAKKTCNGAYKGLPAFRGNSRVHSFQNKVSSGALLSEISASLMTVKDKQKGNHCKQKDKLQDWRVHCISKGQESSLSPSQDEASFVASNIFPLERNALAKPEFATQGERDLLLGSKVTHVRTDPNKEKTTVKRKPDSQNVGLLNCGVAFESYPTKMAQGLQGSGQAPQQCLELPQQYCHFEKKMQVACGNVPLDAGLLDKDSRDRKPMALKHGVEKLAVEDAALEHKIKKMKREKQPLHQEASIFRKNLSHVNQQEKIDTSNSAVTAKMIGLGSIQGQLSQFLNYLMALALNPLHGLENDMSMIVLRFCLQFRSFAYEKNTDLVAAESHPTYPASTKRITSSICQNSQDLPSALKPPKKRLMLDDYAKLIYDSDVYGVDKKPAPDKKFANKKSCMSPDRGGKEVDMADRLNPVESAPKKLKTPEKAVKPTILVMHFPRQSALPSISELKAKFARFGPFNSSPQVCWKSSRCEVPFKYKHDAKVAWTCARQSRSMFGDVKVHYNIQSPVFSKSSNVFSKEATNKIPMQSLLNTRRPTGPKSREPSEQQLAATSPKSCLKQPLRHKPKSMKGSYGGHQHGKFLLCKEDQHFEASSAVQIDRDDCPTRISSSSTKTFNDQTKNFTKAVPLLWPELPVVYHQVYQFVEECNAEYRQVEQMATHECTNQNVDISGAMLDLLKRCNTIVTNLKSSLGYLPHHL